MAVIYISLTDQHAADFWAQADRVNGDGECWLWRGRTDTGGYPVFHVKGSPHRAQRVAWVLDHDYQLPSHHWVRVSCDNKTCVRPEHIKRQRKAPSKTANGQEKNVKIIKPPGSAKKGQWGKARQRNEIKEIGRAVTALVSGVNQLNGVMLQNRIKFAELDAALKHGLRLSQDLIEKATRESAAVAAQLKLVREEMVEIKHRQLVPIDDDSRETSVPESAPIEPIEPMMESEEGPAEPEVTSTLRGKLAPVTPGWQFTESTEPASDSTTTKKGPVTPIEESETEKEEDTTLGALLGTLFADALKVEVPEEEYPTLVTIYADAQQEVRNGTTPVELLNEWLSDFRQRVAADSEVPCSVAQFRRIVDALILPPPPGT